MRTVGQFSEALLEAIRRAGLDTVAGAFAYDSGSDMTVPWLGHRERRRVALTDADGCNHVLFMKRYGREPLTWRLQRWATYGRSGSPAEVELANIRSLHDAGIATIARAVGGSEPGRLGPRRSYILMAAVPGEALEQSFEPFLDTHGLDSEPVRRLTGALADLVRRFHRAGFVHRDLYTSHLYLDDATDEPSLHMIDVARVFTPHQRRFRWQVKDLAQLKYSAPRAWIDAYWDTFMTGYLAGLDRRRGRYERAVGVKADRIAHHDKHLRHRRGLESIESS